MIYYNFIGGEVIAQPSTIGNFDSVIFYNTEDIISITNAVPMPDTMESSLISIANFNCATYVRDEVFPDETVMTAEEIDTGFKVRRLIKKIKLKKYYDISIKNAFSSLDTERETWERQKIEADAYFLDVNASTPFLDALSAARGITKAEVVTKILDKAELYALAVGNLLGDQYKHEDALELCTDLTELDALVLPEFCTLLIDTITPEPDPEPEPEPEA